MGISLCYVSKLEFRFETRISNEILDFAQFTSLENTRNLELDLAQIQASK